jgi:hypothetical protein
MHSVNRRQNLWVHTITIMPTSFQGSVSSDVEKIIYIGKGLNNAKRGTEVRGENHILAPKSPSQIRHGLVWDPTRSSALRSWGPSDTWLSQHLVTVGKFDVGGDGSVSERISVRNRLSPEGGRGMWPLYQQYFKTIKGSVCLYISQWWSPTVKRTKCF